MPKRRTAYSRHRGLGVVWTPIKSKFVSTCSNNKRKETPPGGVGVGSYWPCSKPLQYKETWFCRIKGFLQDSHRSLIAWHLDRQGSFKNTTWALGPKRKQNSGGYLGSSFWLLTCFIGSEVIHGHWKKLNGPMDCSRWYVAVKGCLVPTHVHGLYSKYWEM